MKEFKSVDETINYFAIKFEQADSVQVTRENLDSQIKELRHVPFKITNPLKCLNSHEYKPMRNFLPFCVGDFVDQILANNISCCEHFFNKKTRQKFFDPQKIDGVRQNYTYGQRWYHANQIQNIYNRLKDNSNSRQALLNIWNSEIDSNLKSWNIPCTVIEQFSLRNNKLDLSVYYRSNDFFGGFRYDMFFSAALLNAFCGFLNVDIGDLCIYIDSFHVYDWNFKHLENLNLQNQIEKHYYKDKDIYNDTDLQVSTVNYDDFYNIMYKINTIAMLSQHKVPISQILKLVDNIQDEYYKNVAKVFIEQNYSVKQEFSNEFGKIMKYWRI